MELLYNSVSLDTVKGHRATIVRAGVVLAGGTLIEATGEAVRDPADRHDDEVAIKLAAGRALETLARRVLKQANGKVKSLDDNSTINKPANLDDPLVDSICCAATTSKGQQCGNYPTVTNGVYCHVHGG
jgi:hypothetical protein